MNKDYIIFGWETPKSDGGDRVQGYSIEKSLKGGAFVNAGRTDASTSEYKVSKLFEGNEYTFRVIAENRVGPSPPCTMATPVKARLPYG